jgi:tetratricopeptide (TPR) repeat protein
MLLLLLTWTLVFPSSVAGQQGRDSIQGTVTADGISVRQPVIVYLEALGSRPVEQVLTDDYGRFTFIDIPAGTYYVRVKHEDFEEVAQRVELPPYDRDLTILLQRKPDVRPAAGEIILGNKFEVDVRQLSIPENALREYQKALEENESGKTSGAIKRLRQALQLAPNFIEAAFHLGSTLYKIGHFSDAENTLRRALTIAPREPHLHLMLANVLLKEGKYEQALSEIDSYLEDNPQGAERNSAELTRSQLIKAMKK